MSEIIQSDSELRQYIPNVLATAEGEPSLFEKLKPYLDSAEQWALQYFGSENVIHRMYSFGEEYKIIVSKMVAYQAFMQAIPNLDLVLTPNGFGIVNNSNVASASKERVERLLAQLEAQRDNAIEQYLRVFTSLAYTGNMSHKVFTSWQPTFRTSTFATCAKSPPIDGTSIRGSASRYSSSNRTSVTSISVRSKWPSSESQSPTGDTTSPTPSIHR